MKELQLAPKSTLVEVCYREGGQRITGKLRMIERPNGEQVFSDPKTHLRIDPCRIIGVAGG